MSAIEQENPLRTLARFGQSVWCDNISRDLLRSGGLLELIARDGVVGVTSNPTIFKKAMTGGREYDDDIRELLHHGESITRIRELLSLRDIAEAADALRPVYERTNGADGYVSVEVGPKLAHDTQGSLAEARRFRDALQRPNVMVKIPGTREGARAVEQATREGMSINITLLFGIGQYERVMEAYMRGLEARVSAGESISGIHSVASFFVSRVDTVVDKRLDELCKSGRVKSDEAAFLRGKAGIANSRIAYQHFERKFRGHRWEELAAEGATVQRPLWASTGVKDPSYPDTMYVDALIGHATVNTMPEATIRAYRDHGHPSPDTVCGHVEASHAVIERCAQLGILIEDVAQNLQDEGIESFAKATRDLDKALAQKGDRLRPHAIAG